MGATVQFSVNNAMEGTMILLLSILLVTCIWKKRLFLTTTPLIYLLSFSILVHIVRIVIWSMYLQDVLLKYGALPFRFIYILEYISLYSITVAFYYYMEALVIAGYQNIGVTYKPHQFIHTALVEWGIVTSLIYAGALFVPSLYRVEMGREIFSIPAYIFLLVMIKFACVCVIVLIIRHRKVINKHDALLSVFFVLFISFFSIIDELCNLCVSYVLMSLMIFLLYVRIDLHKGLLLERQEIEVVGEIYDNKSWRF